MPLCDFLRLPVLVFQEYKYFCNLNASVWDRGILQTYQCIWFSYRPNNRLVMNWLKFMSYFGILTDLSILFTLLLVLTELTRSRAIYFVWCLRCMVWKFVSNFVWILDLMACLCSFRLNCFAVVLLVWGCEPTYLIVVHLFSVCNNCHNLFNYPIHI